METIAELQQWLTARKLYMRMRSVKGTYRVTLTLGPESHRKGWLGIGDTIQAALDGAVRDYTRYRETKTGS